MRDGVGPWSAGSSCGVQDPGQRDEELLGLLLGEHERRGEADPVGHGVVDQEPGGAGLWRRRRPTPARASRMPISSPAPSTPRTSGWPSCSTAVAMPLPTSAVCSSSPSAAIVSSTASAAAAHTGLPPNVVPWCPGSSSSPAAPRPMHAPMGRPPPRPLASVTTSGTTPTRLVGEPGAGAADAGLHLVEHEQRPALRGDLPRRREVARRRGDGARLAHDRFEEDRGRVGVDGGGRARRRRRRARATRRA